MADKKQKKDTKKSSDTKEETTNGAQDVEQAAPQDAQQGPGLQIMVQYIRDLSFENPGAPNVGTNQNAAINVSANVGARKLSDTDYEVGLKFRIEAKNQAEADADKAKDGDTKEGDAKEGSEETVQFIAELEYCGIFRLLNVPENDVKPVLLIEGPRQLFPFARRILADATRDGGYPPIMLDPIDFLALYRQKEAADANTDIDTEAIS